MSLLRRLLLVVAPKDHRRFAIGLGFGAVGGFVELAGVAGIYPFLALLSRPEIARTNRYLVHFRDIAGLADERRFLLVFGALCLTVFLLSTAFLLLRQLYLARFALLQTAQISTRLLRSYLAHPYAFFLNQHSADLAKNVISQSDSVANGVLLAWMTIFSECFVIAALAGLVIWMDPIAGLVSIIGLGALSGLLLIGLRGRIEQFGRAADAANGHRFAFCLETLQSIKEIKAAGAEDHFWRKFAEPASAFATTYARTNTAQLLPSPIVQGAAVGAMMSMALWLIARGKPPAEIVPLLSIYAAAGYRLMPSLSRLSVAASQVRQHRVSFDNVTQILSAEPAEAPATTAGNTSLLQKLELRGLSFSYSPGGPKVLDGIDLVVPRGSFVALAGGSGAGKTTLADIILGLLTPQSGQILADGRILSAADMTSWRQKVGYIPQTLFLTDETIAANIAFGVAESDIDMERVGRAARMASLDVLIESLPNGYRSRVGERGSKLSGGQRQRLGIARALYRDPDLLILDESTSALDGITEAEVMTALKGLHGLKTVIVIAHRPTTIKDCDTVVLLKEGRVSTTGRYEDLIARDPHFAALMSHTGQS